MNHLLEQRIVVGIDGSAASLAALRWALREASASDSSVEVIHCWEPHTLTDTIFGSPEGLQRGSTCMLRNEVQAAMAAVAAQVRVREISSRGRPASVLLERAVHAELLVLGTHRLTDLHDIAVGRIATTCLRHAPCPVVIVDDTETVRHRTEDIVVGTVL